MIFRNITIDSGQGGGVSKLVVWDSAPRGAAPVPKTMTFLPRPAKRSRKPSGPAERKLGRPQKKENVNVRHDAYKRSVPRCQGEN